MMDDSYTLEEIGDLAEMKCPDCQSPLDDLLNQYKCSAWDRGCAFFITKGKYKRLIDEL